MRVVKQLPGKGRLRSVMMILIAAIVAITPLAGSTCAADPPAEGAAAGSSANPAASSALAPVVRVKDITRVFGVRDNQLIGYGLVVGLKGTGDSKSTPFTARSLSSMLEKFKISVDPLEIKAKNVAAVMVTATLPAFAKPGDTIPIVASSVGDAKSILGGTLLMTELAGADGRVYAVAQGPLAAGADALPTVGRAAAGATVEGYVQMDMITEDGMLVLSLINPDYATADRIARAANGRFGAGTAVAVDAGTVSIAVPAGLLDTPTPFVAEVGMLEVAVDAPAKVVLNSRTGVVVIGGNVKISPAAVSYNGFSVRVGAPSGADGGADDPGTAGAGAGGSGIRVAGTGTGRDMSTPGSTVLLEAGSSIQALITSLNAVGARPRDIMSIMEALKAAGALQAELEIM